MKFNEQVTVENYIIKFIKDKLGFEYIKPEEFAKLRDLESEYIIKSQLLDAVKRINKVDDTVAKSVLREVNKIDSNQEFLNKLREGVNLMNPSLSTIAISASTRRKMGIRSRVVSGISSLS